MEHLEQSVAQGLDSEVLLVQTLNSLHIMQTDPQKTPSP